MSEASNPYAALQSVPDGYIAEYVAGSPDPILIQVSGRPPHQQRVVTERDDLQTKLDALSRFIDSDLFETLPAAEQGLLLRQRLVMIDYVAVLNERIAAFV